MRRKRFARKVRKIFVRRKPYENRWASPHYKAWREMVLMRDRKTCQMPDCDVKVKLQAHHIKPWATHIALRFVISNGITLCQWCHKIVSLNEARYEDLFTQIVKAKVIRKKKEVEDGPKEDGEGESHPSP